MTENPYNQIFSACQEAMVEHSDMQCEIAELKKQLQQARAERDEKQQRLQQISHMIVEAEAGSMTLSLAYALQEAAGFVVGNTSTIMDPPRAHHEDKFYCQNCAAWFERSTAEKHQS